MAATIFGFDTNEIKPQPGLSIRRTENGGYEASHEVVIKASDFAATSGSFAKGQLLSGIDAGVPQPYSLFLTIDDVTFVRSEGDLYTFQVTATGSGNSQYEKGELGLAALPTYELRGQLYDAPFSDHRKWKPLSDADKTALGLLISGQHTYNITDQIIYLVTDSGAQVAVVNQLSAPDAFEFAKRIAQGQTTYSKPIYTWTETTEGIDQLTPAQLNKLGLIATPRGNPPTPAGDRNWMLTSPYQSQSGELYRTQLEWTLSDEGGHDDFLYED
jgi:hypothetical protein